MTDSRFVHALALGLDPAWRRLTADERFQSAAELAAVVDAESDVATHTYSMIGLQADADLLLWSLASSLDALEEKAASVLRSGMGRWMKVSESFLGIIQPSQYVKKPTPQEQSLFSGEQSRSWPLMTLWEKRHSRRCLGCVWPRPLPSPPAPLSESAGKK